ncbi:hypothetical protein [Rhizobium nepotum]|uniref:Saccharopine dehydrogenase n=1 Tax=Rhizobium nepotum 39/7 TaxID=1368418 RepID=A0ABR5CK24_9HYPH|nr:hypothetical protein [Rhizobium nepotum]KJF65208.1 hypothetical protein RS75_24545 [Rhizobium nepotum 39/7]
MTAKILFVGGSGVVGQQMVRLFRKRHPELPILIGGRDVEKAYSIAQDVGLADAVQVDTAQPRLGLDPDIPVSAVVMLAPDAGLYGLRFAQDMRLPYLSIGNWLIEVGAEMAHFMRRPDASPVVLSSHWHGGPSIFLAIASSKDLDVVHSIKVGAIVDDLDSTGPAALEDMEMAVEGASSVLGFKGGRRVWLSGDNAKRSINAIDGRPFSAAAFAPYDIVSLHAATGAQEVRFDLASGISSSRLRGGDVGTELILEIEGEIDGRPTVRRSTLEFTRGQATLTGLSAVLSLSTTLGLEGRPAVPPSLYFPEQLMGPNWFLEELRQAGATINIDLS